MSVKAQSPKHKEGSLDLRSAPRRKNIITQNSNKPEDCVSFTKYKKK